MTTIVNQKILGVTANAFHLRNGNLIVQGVETVKKLFKERDSAEHANVKGNFHNAYETATGNTTIIVDAGGDFVNYSANSSRSTETVTLILPDDVSALPDGSFKTNLTAMLNGLTGMVTEEGSDVDYLEPSADVELWDLDGNFAYDENGTVFTVTNVTVANNVPTGTS